VLETTKTITSSQEFYHTMTVEEFLRKIPTMPVKLYSSWKKRRLPDSKNPHQTSSPGRDVSDTRIIREKNAQKRRGRFVAKTHGHLESSRLSDDSHEELRSNRKKIHKPLAKRLLRAAAMTGVQPGQILCSDDSRLPLRFVSVNPSPQSSPAVDRRGRTLTLVDPRRISPFREATFASEQPSNVGSTYPRPLTKWRTRLQDEERTPRPRIKRATRTKPTPLRDNGCIPLPFIPLQDAEAAYQTRLASLPWIAFFSFKTLVDMNSFLQMLSALGSDQCSDKFERDANMQPWPCATICGYLPAWTDYGQSVSKPSSLCQKSTRKSSENSISDPIPEPLTNTSDHSSTSFSPTRSMPCGGEDIPMFSQPLQTGGSGLKKSLKVLSSFFDGFLETARNAEKT
jgi:hypothetical protein